MNLTSIKDVRTLLEKHNLRPKKGLGQNFLIDNNVVSNIVLAITSDGDRALEIGPGLGVLSSNLKDLKELVCVETDSDMIEILGETTSDCNNIKIYHENFLNTDISSIIDVVDNNKWVACGNLPYYITTPIIIKLLENRTYFKSIVMMVQKEVADRMKAAPNNKDYGSLSLFVQYHAKVEIVCNVSKNCFYPAPKVDSAVVKLHIYDTPLFDVDEDLYFNITRAAFGKRRKTLANALSNSTFLYWGKEKTQDVLNKAGIDPNRRGETLSLAEYATICNVAKK